MKLNPIQIIIIGAAVVFGVPIAAGIVIGRFFEAVSGVIAGVIIFILILMIAHRKMMKMMKDGDNE